MFIVNKSVFMTPFDPLINYGPNDAGVSSYSIILIVVFVLISSWLFGALYGLITRFIFKKDSSVEKDD